MLLHNCGVGCCQSPTTLWIGHVHTHTHTHVGLSFSMNKVNHIKDMITLVYTRLMMSISHCKTGLFHQVLLTALALTSMSRFGASSWFWSYVRCGIYMHTEKSGYQCPCIHDKYWIFFARAPVIFSFYWTNCNNKRQMRPVWCMECLLLSNANIKLQIWPRRQGQNSTSEMFSLLPPCLPDWYVTWLRPRPAQVVGSCQHPG